MNIIQRTQGDVRILCLEGKITLGEGDQELSEAVRAALDNGTRRIVLNFEKVSYLDSSGVGELVGCYTSIKKAGGELKICGMNSRTLGLITLTGLHSVFAVAETEAEAVAGF
ncbi:STAS domain-containing protein [Holophaga foetida]|uniref:STAS domain-containing protein n=1 Tax=Holophaga foetida TaxID=35839 RepID=UPI00024742E8|nr:STAS domain-containing protein [Holophaga foetida]